MRKKRNKIVKELMRRQGAAVNTIRMELGFNQTKFAAKIGTSQTYLSRIEHGHQFLSEHSLEVLVDKFHVNIEYLTVLKGEMFNQNK